MALNINTTITTDEGFEVSNAFAYLNIYILAPTSNWVNVSYYKSKSDWETGKAPLNVNTLPSNVQTELTSEQFWSNVLAITIHDKCKDKIEEVTGVGTVTIDTIQI
jgi:hypothetical protein